MMLDMGPFFANMSTLWKSSMSGNRRVHIVTKPCDDYRDKYRDNYRNDSCDDSNECSVVKVVLCGLGLQNM